MIYAGEDDFIVNWLGIRRWVRAMEWSGRDAFNATDPVPLVVDGVTGGDVIESGKLSFVKVSESGHMVPMDQPRNAVVMLKRFISGEPIAGPAWDPNSPKSVATEKKAETTLALHKEGDRSAGARVGREPRRAMGDAAAAVA